MRLVASANDVRTPRGGPGAELAGGVAPDSRPPNLPYPLRLAALGAGLAMLAALSACGKRPVAEPPRIVVRYEEARPVQEAQGRRLQTYLGMVRGDTETDLSFKVGGILELIGRQAGQDWPEGETVRKGELLARLKQSDFLSANDSALARANFEGTRWTNNYKLFFTGQPAISKQEWEQTDSTFKAAKAEWQRTQQALADSKIEAPFEGTILARLVNNGQTVMQGQRVLRLADLRRVSVELGVPDRVVNRVNVGDPIQVTINALEEATFAGTVSEVGAGAIQDSRLYKVVLKVNNPRGRIRSGMTAAVSFADADSARTNAVLVRLSALVMASRKAAQGGKDQLAVFVVGADGRVQERPVKTDDIIRSSIMVTTNLSAGEKVVVTGASLLYDGALVTAKPLEGRAP